MTDDKENQTSANFVTYFIRWEEQLQEIVTLSDLTSSTAFDRLRSMHELTDRIQSTCYGRRFFISKHGLIGLCPKYSAQHDVICMAPGVATPFLLREDSTQKTLEGEAAGRYLLIGSCYVRGLMEREGILTDLKTEHLSIV